MQKYLTRWIDYKLPTGQEFSVAVCGYSGKVRHMYLGDDPIRRMIAQHVYAEEGFCQIGDHCLALDCPLNRAEQEHLLHMLDQRLSVAGGHAAGGTSQRSHAADVDPDSSAAAAYHRAVCQQYAA